MSLGRPMYGPMPVTVASVREHLRLERERCDRMEQRALKLREQRDELLAALKALHELGAHVPIFQLDDGKSSVKAVRLAGKFTGAMDAARAAIEKAEAPILTAKAEAAS